MCQYQTPEGFSKAFKQQHRCSPLTMRKYGNKGNPFTQIVINQEMLQKDIYYQVREVETFYLEIYTKKYKNDNQNFIVDIQNFWKEIERKSMTLSMLERKEEHIFPRATFLAIDTKREAEDIYFTYGIGVERKKGNHHVTIPSGVWLVFPCIGPVNTSIQKVWRNIYYYFLEDTIWEIRADYNMEVYFPGNKHRSDYKCEIWVPVKERKKNVGSEETRDI